MAFFAILFAAFAMILTVMASVSAMEPISQIVALFLAMLFVAVSVLAAWSIR